LATLLVVVAAGALITAPTSTASILLTAAGLVLFLQASIEVWRMAYAYREPEAVDKLRFPEADGVHETFCLIVPARHESSVLTGTLLQLAKQTHSKVQIISVICDDDEETLDAAYRAAMQDPRISVMQYPLLPGVKPSKPLQLNYVLEQTAHANYTVFGIIDAEDTVHPELLMHVDAAFRDPEVGVVQGGVQLMNHDTSWFSLHNVLEYYRWFNSAMAFQSDSNFMPLGGNTIFVRNDLLRRAGGWPVTLTEDCSLGVLLSSRFRNGSSDEFGGAKTAVYYDPSLATREETPDTLKALFKQRVRWNQGFFHEWRRGIWEELPSFRQRVLAAYVLLSPVILATVSLIMVASLFAALFLDAPVGLVMMMYLPLVPVSLLAILNGIFLHDFGKAFQRKVTFRQYVLLFLTQPFYQIVLNAASFWSVVRELRGDQTWYKTEHSGQHREPEAPAYE
jgi:cellulose synthase/poly-beta-1,6-N-acetylglucosamine synthase-like glycosyltransferase